MFILSGATRATATGAAELQGEEEGAKTMTVFLPLKNN